MTHLGASAGTEGPPPLADPGNPLTVKLPANLVVGKVQTPDGERGVVTIRTAGGATLTVILDRAEAADWADNLAALRDSLSGTKLVVPGRGDAMRIADSARNGQPR